MEQFFEALSCNICMSFTHFKNIKCNLSFLLTFCFLSFHFHSCFCYSYMINDLCVLSLFFLHLIFASVWRFFFPFLFFFFLLLLSIQCCFLFIDILPSLFVYLFFFMALLVEVNFNSYKKNSHYCNNIFALQYAHIHNLCLDSKHI